MAFLDQKRPLNGQQQKFVMLVIGGKSLVEAFREAWGRGNRSKTTLGNAAVKKSLQPRIAAELSKQRELLQQRNHATIDEALSRLADTMRVNLVDLLNIDSGVISMKDLGKLTTAQEASIKKIKLNELGHLESLEVLDPVRSIELVLKAAGVFAKEAQSIDKLTIIQNFGPGPPVNNGVKDVTPVFLPESKTGLKVTANVAALTKPPVNGKNGEGV